MEQPSIEYRILTRAAELKRQAEEIRHQAEKQIAALLTAAAELEALLQPIPEVDPDEEGA